MDKPIFWIIGGPNGSGKTTASRSPVVRRALRDIPILNPDDVTLREIKRRGHAGFASTPPDELRDVFIDAANAVEAKIAQSLRRSLPVGVESVHQFGKVQTTC